MNAKDSAGTPAMDRLFELRRRLNRLSTRATIAHRDSTMDQRSPNQKTIEVLAKCIELDTYAETLMHAVARVEEDAANDAAFQELNGIMSELDSIGVALRERVQGPREPRLDRSG